MEQFLPCGSDHSGSTSGSHTLSEGDEEKTPEVRGDGDDCVSSEWNSAHKETPVHEDSEEDEDEKVNTAIWTRLGVKYLVKCCLACLVVLHSGGACRNEASVMFSSAGSRNRLRWRHQNSHFTSAVKIFADTCVQACLYSQTHRLVLSVHAAVLLYKLFFKYLTHDRVCLYYHEIARRFQHPVAWLDPQIRR